MTIETALSVYPVFSGIILGVVATVGCVIRWLNGRRSADLQSINDQRIDDIRIHEGSHALQNVRFSAVEQKAISHDSALDRVAIVVNDNAIRVARLEIAVDNFEKGQIRIEHGQELIKAELKSNFQELAKSIREIRNMPLRPDA